MIDGNLVVAYHGCDVTTRDGLVSRRLSPVSSENEYDWLGPGFYFFEADSERALSFAKAAFENPQERYTARPIATPAVVGALLKLTQCLDMTTREGLGVFERGVGVVRSSLEKQNEPIPVNQPKNADDTDVLLRRLDNIVFKTLHEEREKLSAPPYECVRAAFRQGEPLAENSGFHRDSHVQLALRDMTCVVGWFLLPGDVLLSENEHQAAREAMAVAEARYKKKPRVRVPLDQLVY